MICLQERTGFQARPIRLTAERLRMATGTMTIWFDLESDFLEVLVGASRPGYFRETPDDRVMEKLDENGVILGFSILGVSSMRSRTPLEVLLASAAH